MTITLWFLAGVLILAAFLVILAALNQRPSEPLPPRPLPYPNTAKAPSAHPRALPPERQSRHSLDDQEAVTRRLNGRRRMDLSD